MSPLERPLPPSALPPALRDLRRAAGFATQEDLAAALCIDRRTVTRWERGQCRTPVSLRLWLQNLAGQHSAATQGDAQ